MKRLLIIDDEEKIVQFYRKYLEGEGFEVLTARNAQEGTFMMIRSGRIDLILLDINMPEISGDFMREIIEEFNPQLKVLSFSVHSVEEQKALIPDAAGYFDKSHSIDLLVEKIQLVLGEKGSISGLN